MINCKKTKLWSTLTYNAITQTTYLTRDYINKTEKTFSLQDDEKTDKTNKNWKGNL